MDKDTFCEKWIRFIGLGLAMSDEEKSLWRREATDDLDSLSATQWWRKWGGFYCGWPGGAPKENSLKDLTRLLRDLKQMDVAQERDIATT